MGQSWHGISQRALVAIVCKLVAHYTPGHACSRTCMDGKSPHSGGSVPTIARPVKSTATGVFTPLHVTRPHVHTSGLLTDQPAKPAGQVATDTADRSQISALTVLGGGGGDGGGNGGGIGGLGG